MDTNSLPEWIQWVAGGTALTIVGIISKLGWRGQTSQTSAVEIAGGIITDKAAKAIIEAIQDAMEVYEDTRKEDREVARDMLEANRRLAEEIRILGREVRERSRAP